MRHSPAHCRVSATRFTGRDGELRQLSRLLAEGRNIILTGVFGTGRTALIHQLARAERRQFMFWCSKDSYRTLRLAVRRSRAVPVVVMDDVVHVTPQRLRLFRELLRARRCQFIVIVERSLPDGELMRLRAALQAPRPICLGPLSEEATERYFALAVREHGLNWTPDEIRLIAQSTHGHPLIMRATIDVAVAGRS